MSEPIQQQLKKNCNIPPEKRFQKGKSGNPGGKPKGTQNFKTIIENIGRMPAPKEMLEKIKDFFPDFKKRGLTMKEAMTLKAYIDALKGDDKSREFIADRDEGKAPQTIKSEGPIVSNVYVTDQATKDNLEKLSGALNG